MINKIAYISLIFLILISTSSRSFADTETLSNLDQLGWKNRILLIDDELGCDENLIKKLTSESFEVNDRDLIWFVFCEQNVETNYSGLLSDNFATVITSSIFDRRQEPIILIGKDGGIKRSATTLDLGSLFNLIDSMPMRQVEMQQ